MAKSTRAVVPQPWIRRLLIRQNKTQADLGRAMGLGQDQMSRLVSGARGAPPLHAERVGQMARFFSVAPSEILAYIEGAISDYNRGMVEPMPAARRGPAPQVPHTYADPLMKATRDLPAVRLALRIMQEAVATLRAAGYEIKIQVTPPSDVTGTQGANIDIE
jgi:transcriptional regulator with XRE-family HTH domain